MSGSAGSTQIRNDGDGGCNDDDSGDGSCDDDDGDDSGCDENDNAVMQVAAVLSSSVLRHQQHQYTLGRLPTDDLHPIHGCCNRESGLRSRQLLPIQSAPVLIRQGNPAAVDELLKAIVMMKSPLYLTF